jgi:hypothetical protein
MAHSFLRAFFHGFAGVSGRPPETGRAISAPPPELIFTMSISGDCSHAQIINIEHKKNNCKEKMTDGRIFLKSLIL